jgi:hypothetical protein
MGTDNNYTSMSMHPMRMDIGSFLNRNWRVYVAGKTNKLQ